MCVIRTNVYFAAIEGSLDIMLGISTNSGKDLDKEMSYTLMCAAVRVRRVACWMACEAEASSNSMFIWFDGAGLCSTTLWLEGVNTHLPESDLIRQDLLWVSTQPAACASRATS